MQSFSLGLVTPRNFTVTNASNSTPIVITTAANTFVSGDVVTVKAVTTNTNANGAFYAAVLTPTTLALYSNSSRTTPVAGNGNYGGGGVISAPQQLKPSSADPLATVGVAKILYAPQAGTGTGLLFVGIAGMNQATLFNVLRIINPPPATGLLDNWELDLDGSNVFNLTDYWVDAQNASSEGVVVSYFRR